MLNDWYAEKLAESKLYKSLFNCLNAECDYAVIKDIHLKLQGFRKSYYGKHARLGGGSYTIKSVDMYKIEQSRWAGEMESEEFVLVQEYDWRNGRCFLKREYFLTCEEANHLYIKLRNETLS